MCKTSKKLICQSQSNRARGNFIQRMPRTRSDQNTGIRLSAVLSFNHSSEGSRGRSAADPRRMHDVIGDQTERNESTTLICRNLIYETFFNELGSSKKAATPDEWSWLRQTKEKIRSVPTIDKRNHSLG